MKKDHFLTGGFAVALMSVYVMPLDRVSLGTRIVMAIGVSFMAGLTLGRVAVGVGVVILILLGVVAETTIRHPPPIPVMLIAIVTLTLLQGSAVFVGSRLKEATRRSDSRYRQ